MAKKIKFTIDENGEVTLDVQGVVGDSCEGLTAPFEAALGITEKRELKDSYYQQATEEEKTEINNG